MQRTVKIICLSFLLSIALFSCKDENSIQTYFVEHQDLPEFRVIDLAANLMDFSKTELSDEQKETLNSFKKLNFLGYKIQDGDMESYTKELAKAKKVFKNEKYSELAEFSDGGNKFRISTIGTDEAVDEILVLMSSTETGFGIVRVLGDKMNPEKMMALVDDLQNAEVDENQLKDIMDFFK